MLLADSRLYGLERESKPIRVALLGAGVTGKMIALQLLTPAPGLRLVAIANRTPAKAGVAYSQGGVSSWETAETVAQVEDAIAKGQPVVTSNALLLCQASNIDIVIEATGTVEFAATVALEAIRHRKHVVLVNAELDSTVGPLLKYQADQAGVVITNTDGDEPGVAMNLFRYLRSVGLKPVAAGNLKGMIDPYRTPETQREFAAKYNQNAVKVTSFADGTKLAMEATILANATGFGIGKRGMFGPRCAHVSEMATLLPLDRLLQGGIVDYALGAAPHTGAFVIVFEDNARKRKELAYYKMGEGPLYVFYTPYHLPHIQLAATIARAVLMNDATVAPGGAPACEVVTLAKRDIKAGEILDGVGGFTAYGVIEASRTARQQNLLPIGLAEGCRVQHDIAKDEAIRVDQISVPPNRLIDRLWQRQCQLFAT
jgi:predicted homoserine dehydrogenase-like protein